MLNNETVRKLHEMRLSVMAEASPPNWRMRSSKRCPLRTALHTGRCGVEHPEKQSSDPAHP